MKNALLLLQHADEAFPITKMLPGATALPRHSLMVDTTFVGKGRLCLSIVRDDKFYSFFLDPDDMDRDPKAIIEDIGLIFSTGFNDPDGSWTV